MLYLCDMKGSAEEFTKWVACWGTATSITDRRECVYAKDITLRYPLLMPFDGSRVRIRFSNLTGTEPVTLTRVSVAVRRNGAHGTGYDPVSVTFGGDCSGCMEPGYELTSDEIDIEVHAGDTLEVSIYLGECTQMNAGTLVTGPLSRGQYSYGDYAERDVLPMDRTRSTSWFYFLNTVDTLTAERNHALICYGDSITAQSWPDYLALRAREEGYENVSIIRRAVCGTRILREYSCIQYAAYGLKGATRFPIEANAAGASAVIIQHGINDIIHPVGVDVNPFRPWSDMPSCEDLKTGVRDLYIAHARMLGLKVYSGTLLPIKGWRTYTPVREALRHEFNEWLRTAAEFDGCIDFDKAVRAGGSADAVHAGLCDSDVFAPGFDSGDHLHPSETAYKAMADAVPADLLK